MVTDQQVRRLFMNKSREKYQYQAADKAGMADRTAYKYIRAGKLPSEMKCRHDWQTRKDPFGQDWDEIVEMLKINPGLLGKTIFNYFQGTHEGRYQDGQLRTLQRRIKQWKATEGPAKEVYFPQKHYPGDLSASDFTHMNSVEVTIQGEIFSHLLYHFVLTYSNWETFSICYSESFESLSTGFQNAIWELGGATKRHRTDRMSAAVNRDCNPEKFNAKYQALLNHYGIVPERTNAASANENGDVETSHRHFKRAVLQGLMLRGSKDFNSISEYGKFLRGITDQLNAGRRQRFKEEVYKLKELPATRIDDSKRIDAVRVGRGSTINLQHNTYSVHSRLIGEQINVRIYMDYIEIWYAQKKIDSIPRLRGSKKHKINYRHIIDWLVRKPGAFENYRYKEDLYPSSLFRMTYDWLRSNMPLQANKQYVKVLYYAAKEGESVTEDAIRCLQAQDKALTASQIKEQIDSGIKLPIVTDVTVQENRLESYDSLLAGEVCYG